MSTRPARRRPRSGVVDRWYKRDGTPSANHGEGKRWKASYVDNQWPRVRTEVRSQG